MRYRGIILIGLLLAGSVIMAQKPLNEFKVGNQPKALTIGGRLSGGMNLISTRMTDNPVRQELLGDTIIDARSRPALSAAFGLQAYLKTEWSWALRGFAEYRKSFVDFEYTSVDRGTRRTRTEADQVGYGLEAMWFPMDSCNLYLGGGGASTVVIDGSDVGTDNFMITMHVGYSFSKWRRGLAIEAFAEYGLRNLATQNEWHYRPFDNYRHHTAGVRLVVN